MYGRREVPWNAVWERAKHASWRGGLQALVVVVVVGAGGGERRGGGVDIHTVQTTESETVHG